jgi:hypothetical protein
MLGSTATEPSTAVPVKWMSKKMWCGVLEAGDKFPELFSWLAESITLKFWE